MAEDTVSNENKTLAKYITKIAGINPSVRRYWDENNEHFIDIFTCTDPEDSRLHYYGTVGLSDYPNRIEMKDGTEKNMPVELLIAGYKKYAQVPAILSTCALYVLKDKWSCQPGDVFRHMVDFYYKKRMQHTLFTEPFFWGNEPQPLELDTKTVHWLLAVPISESELQYNLSNGFNALEDLFEQKGVNIFNLDRRPVL